MKKFLFVPLTFISILFFSFSVHAEFMPPALPDMSVVPDFLMTVGQYEMLDSHGVTTSAQDLNTLNQLVNGRTVQQSMVNHYVDNATIDSKNEWQLFYDSQGNLIPVDNTYSVFGSSDVTSYSFVASKSTGEILFSYDQYNQLTSTLSAGRGLNRYVDGLGFPIDRQQEQRNLDNRINSAKSDYMIVYSNQISEQDIRWLQSYEFYASFSSAELGWTCYIPNACTSDTVVLQDVFGNNFKGSFSQGSQYAYAQIYVYTNNPSEVYFSEGKWGYLTYSPSNAFNYSFDYQMYIGNWYAPFYYGGDVDINLPTASEYAQYRELSDDVVYLQPAENQGEVTNIYNYTYTTENPVNPNPIINNNYDNRSETNYYNYPVTNTVSYPDYSNTTNTYISNIYNYYTSPNTNESAGELDDEDLTNNIPIISNLKYRFPFSIPFDLYEMAKVFNVQRETPVIDFSFIIAGLDYEAVIHFDLSEWDDMFALFRTLELILFIVGLAIFSYDHFFGT